MRCAWNRRYFRSGHRQSTVIIIAQIQSSSQLNDSVITI
jgi:hypothetical protein